MSSYDDGKDEVVAWIRQHFGSGSTCLDVGACDGKWHSLLGDYLTMDAVEIWEPNVTYHQLQNKYRRVYCMDIDGLRYDWYDVIIFGDVIEHMYTDKAQRVLDYARERCGDMIIGVPFCYRQDAIYGNPYEKHIQDDLTPELFGERYPGYEIITRPRHDYAYYHKTDAPLQEKMQLTP